MLIVFYMYDTYNIKDDLFIFNFISCIYVFIFIINFFEWLLLVVNLNNILATVASLFLSTNKNYFIRFFRILKKNISNSILSFNNFSVFFYKNNNFIKEGFYLDLLQKISFDLWLKNFIYNSTQIFNLNFLNNYIIKFIINCILNYIKNSITTSDSINLYQIFFNIVIMFILIWHIFYIITINIFIFV